MHVFVFCCKGNANKLNWSAITGKYFPIVSQNEEKTYFLA